MKLTNKTKQKKRNSIPNYLPYHDHRMCLAYHTLRLSTLLVTFVSFCNEILKIIAKKNPWKLFTPIERCTMNYAHEFKAVEFNFSLFKFSKWFESNLDFTITENLHGSIWLIYWHNCIFYLLFSLKWKKTKLWKKNYWKKSTSIAKPRTNKNKWK